MVTIRTASSTQAGLTSVSATDARPSYPCGDPSLDETLTFGARICDRGAGGAPGYRLQPRPNEDFERLDELLAAGDADPVALDASSS